METKSEKQARLSKIYAVADMPANAMFLLPAFVKQNNNQKFKGIDVERINIVEKNDKVETVIPNQGGLVLGD